MEKKKLVEKVKKENFWNEEKQSPKRIKTIFVKEKENHPQEEEESITTTFFLLAYAILASVQVRRIFFVEGSLRLISYFMSRLLKIRDVNWNCRFAEEEAPSNLITGFNQRLDTLTI